MYKSDIRLTVDVALLAASFETDSVTGSKADSSAESKAEFENESKDEIGNIGILLIKRKFDPFKGHWALPGGFVDDTDTTLDFAALRELREETSIDHLDIEQLHSFGDAGRDPRGHTVTVAYLGTGLQKDFAIQAQDDAHEVGWHSIKNLPPLAFDHDKVVACAIERLRHKLITNPICVSTLMPKHFTVKHLSLVYNLVAPGLIEASALLMNFLEHELIEKVAVAPSNLPEETFSFRPDSVTRKAPELMIAEGRLVETKLI